MKESSGSTELAAHVAPQRENEAKPGRLDVLPTQDLQRLLQGLDLLLAHLHALLVAEAGVHAARLELLVVRQGRVELLLRGLEVRLRGHEVRLGRGLVLALVLEVHVLHGLSCAESSVNFVYSSSAA